MLVYNPEVIEFYNYPSSMLDRIRDFCDSHGIRPALHTPTPYDEDEPLRRFAPTGPDAAEAKKALRLVERTVETAARFNALHVVVHFPSPYPPYPEEGFQEFCSDFLGQLDSWVGEYGVPILIENLTPHPALHSPQHYRDILLSHPALGFCLDFGHAHLLGEPGAPEKYAELLGESIQSMHIYNTSVERNPTSGHEVGTPEQKAADGFLELGTLIPAVLRTARPAAAILEYSGRSMDLVEAEKSARWIRNMIVKAREN
ncbi:sugar phosphate isomerase/epimerase [Streptacidiphilus sp. 4-A2]|nr:sugar phosphate isomerase/epimerase [Streptacidiphilus sp. 4-A2]